MNHPRRIDVDTPSIMFSALTTRRWGRTFRLSAALDRDVDPAILAAAVRATLPAFPNMRLTLRRGFFWAKQTVSDAMPEMRTPEGKTLCPITSEYRDLPNFRLVYDGPELILESAHTQGDGRGHLRFFAALLDVYARILNGEDVGEVPQKPGVMENAFVRHYDKHGDRSVPKLSKAFRFPEACEDDYISLSYAETDEAAVHALAHGAGLTVTQYLVAAVILAAIRTSDEPVRLPVRVSVPVDLRRFYPSGTCRNFAIEVPVAFDPQGRTDLTLSDVIEGVRGRLPAQLTKDCLSRQINRFVSLTKNPVLYAVPYFIKKPVLGVLQKNSHRAFTTIFTNLGEKKLPPNAAAIVKRLRFVNGDTRRYALPVTVSCVSCAGRLSVCFTAANRDARFFNAFVAVLREAGLNADTEIVEGAC
ncbi:MAG: hypothetical protein IK104_02255 [Clostridia bacterium]|nr:hypothetical protein [Clostridia bacterium]